MAHRYTIEIETNTDPAYHPYTVSIKQSRELICEFSGASREGLLKLAVKFIAEEEDKGKS